MNRLRRLVVPALAVVVTLSLPPQDGRAQAAQCVATQIADPARVVYDCGNGLLLEAEAAAALGLDAIGSGVAELSGKATLIELPAGSSFQIRTPHAIASVRGTVFVVDVENARSSVFVIEGSVAVTRTDGSGEVVLAPGEGIDVATDQPMSAVQWKPPRVAALLARFAR